MEKEILENIFKETCRQRISEGKTLDINDLDNWDLPKENHVTTKKVLDKTKIFFTKTFDKIATYENEWQDYCWRHPLSAFIFALVGCILGFSLRFIICKSLNREFLTFRKKEGN